MLEQCALKMPEILLPGEECDLTKWAVVACDQFTSQPDYWGRVQENVGGAPSALNLIYPEAWLGEGDARIARINDAMREYERNVLARRFAGFVLVERAVSAGKRLGLIAAVDLEKYDFSRGSTSLIRPTEGTILERIPPRVRIREGASLELSHAMLLMDDPGGTVLDSLTARKDALEPVYDFELMQGGGRIRGRLVAGAEAEAFRARIAAYERETAERFAAAGRAPLLYAVGDGNHSLAAAKACWEERKRQGAPEDDPARYAMAELQNIRDPEQRFEPIHRIVTGVDPALLLRSCAAICAPGGHPVAWYAGKEHGLLTLDPALGELPVAVLQPFLDRFLLEHGGEIDYIHGEEVAVRLAEKPGSVAFLLPNISKGDFFRGIVMDGVLPRKTFSMGHAQEKRYYLECRRITRE